MSERRCGGQCCRGFTIGDGLTTTKLQAFYKAWLARAEECDGELIPEDIHLIAPMVRSLGMRSTNPITGKVLDIPTEYFRCTHLNSSGLCDIYEIRPRMCSEYPQYHRGQRCKYPGCEGLTRIGEQSEPARREESSTGTAEAFRPRVPDDEPGVGGEHQRGAVQAG